MTTNMKQVKRKRYNGEGCIREQKDGRWVARIQIGKTTDGKPKIKALYGHSEREVRKKLRDYQRELVSGIEEVSKLTVAEYIDRWLKVYKAKSVKPSTYDRMENTFIYHVRDSIGYIQVGNINSIDIQNLINEKSEFLSYSSVKKIQELLNACFKQAEIIGDIRRNPMLGVTMPLKKTMNIATKEVEIYTEDDIQKITETINRTFTDKCKLYRYSPIFILMFNTGLRMGEVLALTWDCINFDNKTLRVKETMSYVKSRKNSDKARTILFSDPKTVNSSRIVPLNEKSINALSEILRRNEVQNVKTNYVVSNLNGSYVLPRNFSLAFERVCNRSDVIFKGVHATRHTFASNAIRLGIEVKVVSEILGHSSIQITYNKYVHIIQEQKMKAVTLLDAL